MSRVERKRILITGGAGFIGYHLACKLSREPENDIDLLDNFARGRLDSDLKELEAKPNVRLITGDLTDASTFDRLEGEYDDVYHFAAIVGVRNVIEKPNEVLRVNAIANLNLLQWFVEGGGKKLLFSSTSEAYAWTQLFHDLPIPTPEDVPLSLTDLRDPRSSYAGSKIFCELAVHQYCATIGKPFVIVRYHNIYGPRMGNDHVIPEIYQRALEGQDPLVVFSPHHTRAFCYVDDAIAATMLAMQRSSADGQTINVGNDLEEVTIEELAQRILKKAKLPAKISPERNANDRILRRCPDISRARELLTYEPRVPLEEGLEMTMNWYSPRREARMVAPTSRTTEIT